MGLKTKGAIKDGMDADFFIFDPFSVSKARLAAGIKDSHLLNHTNLVGKIHATFLRGKCTYRTVEFKDRVIHIHSHGEIILLRKPKN
jgi:dihydroorotase-like cyclic amidohydrolase